MVHKPKHKVHSFRGLINDDGEDEIELERQNMNVAYRIVKFELIPYNPQGVGSEAVIIVWRENQTSASATIDFNDPDILAAGYITNSTAGDTSPEDMTVIFDNVLFSRNIFVTNNCQAGSSINYYIELEEVPVGAATLMQLKLGVARKLSLKQ